MTETNNAFMRSNLAQSTVDPAGQRVYAVQETVTPDMARSYLETNTKNRGVSSNAIRQLAGAIIRGEWVLNGETIKFDREGQLIDGQHRLQAIIQAKTPVDMLVVRNAGAGAQDTVDAGTRRNLASQLKIRGEELHVTLAAAVNWLYRLENHNPQRPGFRVSGSNYPTVRQGLTILENNPGLRSYTKIADKINRKHRIPAGLILALYYKFAQLDEQDADVFVEYLISGTGLEEGDPIHALRETFLRYANQYPKPDQAIYAAVTIKAWNAYRDGRQIQRLTWSPGGSRQEYFPTIR